MTTKDRDKRLGKVEAKMNPTRQHIIHIDIGETREVAIARYQQQTGRTVNASDDLVLLVSWLKGEPDNASIGNVDNLIPGQ